VPGPQSLQSSRRASQVIEVAVTGVSVGHASVHATHFPPEQVCSWLQVPHTPSQPFEPQALLPQLGVHPATHVPT